METNVNIKVFSKYGKVRMSDVGDSARNISITEANGLLAAISYEAILYDARPYSDLVKIELEINSKKSEAHVQVNVQKKHIPGKSSRQPN